MMMHVCTLNQEDKETSLGHIVIAFPKELRAGLLGQWQHICVACAAKSLYLVLIIIETSLYFPSLLEGKEGWREGGKKEALKPGMDQSSPPMAISTRFCKQLSQNRSSQNTSIFSLYFSISPISQFFIFCSLPLDSGSPLLLDLHQLGSPKVSRLPHSPIANSSLCCFISTNLMLSSIKRLLGQEWLSVCIRSGAGENWQRFEI